MDWETVSAASREQIDAVPKAVWNEVGAYASPPDIVKQVAALVQLALGQPGDWATSRKTMKDGSFEKRIRDFDPATIDAATLDELRAQMSRVDGNKAARSSKCLPPLIMWAPGSDVEGRWQQGSSQLQVPATLDHVGSSGHRLQRLRRGAHSWLTRHRCQGSSG